MIGIAAQELIDYTDWQRAHWRALLTASLPEQAARQGNPVLELSAGPHGDGRFGTVGDLIKHIFSAEQRYVERLTGRDLSDLTAIPTVDAAALFELGDRSRAHLIQLLATLPESEWEREREFQILTSAITATPRKIVLHILMHEIRHWAQIATILRFHDRPIGQFHDLLFAPALGGGVGTL